VRIEATFVRSAAVAEDFPRDEVPEIALVGRSNVGKSSLINSLVRQRIARTSAAPGKTRLANIYRVARGSGEPLYLVDLPGYGYARGGDDAARGFDELTRAFFRQEGQGGRERREGKTLPALPAHPAPPAQISALLLVDSRHPGLESDLDAWAWLRDTVDSAAIVATKVDKLSRGERIRAVRELESVFEHPVLPVSAVTGEGLDELWILIDNLTNNGRSRNLPRNSSPHRPPKATAGPPARQPRSGPRAAAALRRRKAPRRPKE
jgi:GTP-binding protein